ncbi:ParB/RepB/Spo0J family partition protein [Pseudorhodoplanes sinuspersici]|uniref:Chromosome partitioning protein ParB n=1 Tax=Pseudorhodoplanes sinuspersici TaxID=1235591 RepID=A0A1W6ZNT2_9HYPH|nr:ParB/RepB/Spo0J family partition protein [Pseudorhodoplanes sinuspersici]ARP99053.1 chromosome partitioning protein ParB [Pseudorhodoplanes sinuspersici]RKE69301.1 chromosome segregation DNA-binding protein [Pseudorhodoplanes sinuspersici]
MAEETRSRLGRGLAALMGDVGAESSTSDRAPKSQRRVPIEHVKANPRNPRRIFADAELEELSQSIRERGIIQPIVVRSSKSEPNTFEIIAGERRWRASQRAGLHEVPIVVLEVTDAEALELAIIENIQRADLNPLEEAAGYQALANQYSHSQDDIATIVGKSRSHVANTLRLLKLPDAVKSYINEGKLTAGHARALINQSDPESIARDIVEKGLNVRQVEKLRQDDAKAAKKPKSTAKARKDANIAALEKQLSDALGLVVEITDKGRAGGVLGIRYRTLEQLDDVIAKLQRG